MERSRRPPSRRDVVVAVDIGGTKLAGGLVDGDGRLTERRRGSTPNDAGTDAEGLFQALVALVDPVVEHAGEHAVAIGVGCGGPMTTGGELVSPLNIEAWRDFPLRGRLAERYGLAVVVDNDAKALALAEGWIGAAAGRRDYLAMVVSTGVGGGLVVDGRLLDGATGNAGHIGHVLVEPDGRPCGCGAVGCLEAEASGLAIEAMTGGPPSAAPVEVRRRTGRMVGRAVASMSALVDVPLAVVAGSVALGYGDDFFDAAQGELDERARISFARGARIIPAGAGDAGPLIGAGALGWRRIIEGET
jgi:glucokinase